MSVRIPLPSNVRARKCPAVSARIAVSGYAYDIETGLRTTVVPPRMRRAA